MCFYCGKLLLLRQHQLLTIYIFGATEKSNMQRDTCFRYRSCAYLVDQQGSQQCFKRCYTVEILDKKLYG